jgi:hypothetical protein
MAGKLRAVSLMAVRGGTLNQGCALVPRTIIVLPAGSA